MPRVYAEREYRKLFALYQTKCATISMCYLSKVSWLFPCISKCFLNFRLSSIRLLINCFLKKELVALVKISLITLLSLNVFYRDVMDLCSPFYFVGIEKKEVSDILI